MRALVAEELVLVRLDRADHHVYRVVLHVEPGDVAGAVVVGEERLGALLEVVPERRRVGELRSLAQLPGGDLRLLGVGDVIRDGDEGARRIAAHQRVETLQRIAVRLRRGRRAVERALRDVVRVEVRAGRLRSHAGDERFVVGQPIPWAVVDLHEPARVGVRHGLQQRVAIAVRLPPVDGVHRARRVDEKREHPPLLRRERARVVTQLDRRVLGETLLDGGRMRRSAVSVVVGHASVAGCEESERHGREAR